MLVLQFAVVAAIATLANAGPASVRHVLHEKREMPATDWVKGTRIEGNAVLPMRIGLSQTNLEKGYDYLSMSDIIVQSRPVLQLVRVANSELI
jgi:tripeptidyl-peptidase-1